MNTAAPLVRPAEPSELPAQPVLARLKRIDSLVAQRAPAPAVLAELRALVGEAEAWAMAEGDARAREAVSKLRARTEKE